MIFHQVGFQSDAAAVLATLGLGVVKVTAAVTLASSRIISLLFILQSIFMVSLLIYNTYMYLLTLFVLAVVVVVVVGPSSSSSGSSSSCCCSCCCSC